MFDGIDHHTAFSINIYCNKKSADFDTISNLFVPTAIDECYTNNNQNNVPIGLKDYDGNWNKNGAPDRVLHVSRKELQAFAKVYDGNLEEDAWQSARLPVLQTNAFMQVVSIVAAQSRTYYDLKDELFGTRMWDETNAQKAGTIRRHTAFPDSLEDMIISGPHFGISTPLFKTPRRICKLNSDYDNIDLEYLNDRYIPRSNYIPSCSSSEYYDKTPTTPWNDKCTQHYRLCVRAMVDPGGRRSLIPAIMPPDCGHINSVLMMCFKSSEDLLLAAATLSSLPIDFIIKSTGKSAFLTDGARKLPLLDKEKYYPAMVRVTLLNCITQYYEPLWKEVFTPQFRNNQWSKKDKRLDNGTFTSLNKRWSWETPIRSDFARRQALIEIDVLTAMLLGMSLDQLISIYKIQFSVLQSHESDTWYDSNGRIVFTIDRSMNGVGVSRAEFEEYGGAQPKRRGNESWDGIMKNAPAGYVFERVMTDDTMPGGPVERRIQYVAPFDRCDREHDYEIAWRFFEEKYTKKDRGY